MVPTGSLKSSLRRVGLEEETTALLTENESKSLRNTTIL